MIGKEVIVPIGIASDIEGIVQTYDAESGEITVKDEEGDLYKGFEYQVTYL